MNSGGAVVLSYWFFVGAGVVLGGAVALVPVLWLYRRFGILAK